MSTLTTPETVPSSPMEREGSSAKDPLPKGKNTLRDVSGRKPFISRAKVVPRFNAGAGNPDCVDTAPSSDATPKPRVTLPTSKDAFCGPPTELLTSTGVPPTSACGAELPPANISGANLALEGVKGTFTLAEGATTTGAAALPPPDACGAAAGVGASRKRGDEYPNGSSWATKPAPSSPTPQFPTAKAVPAAAAPSRVPDQLAAATVDVVSNPPLRKVSGMQT